MNGANGIVIDSIAQPTAPRSDSSVAEKVDQAKQELSRRH